MADRQPAALPSAADRRQRSARTAELVDQLHRIVAELEAMHPGRKFSLDGHLVGSIGEATAEAMFDLQLVAVSSAGHDAVVGDGRKVEIKATYGQRSVAILRKSSTPSQQALKWTAHRYDASERHSAST